MGFTRHQYVTGGDPGEGAAASVPTAAAQHGEQLGWEFCGRQQEGSGVAETIHSNDSFRGTSTAAREASTLYLFEVATIINVL